MTGGPLPGPAAPPDPARAKEELRERYYGLLQELRVVLPGVQLIMAFLLTVPFSQGFERLGPGSRAAFGAALLCAVLSVVAFMAPTALHRFGPRRARAARLRLSILIMRVGLALLALTILIAFGVVAQYLFATPVAVLLVAVGALAMLGLWAILPLALQVHERRTIGPPTGDDVAPDELDLPSRG